MMALWLLVLTYAVIAIVVYLVWKHRKERADERRRRGKEYLSTVLAKPEMTESSGSWYVKGAGESACGRTEEAARDAWLDRIWHQSQGN